MKTLKMTGLLIVAVVLAMGLGPIKPGYAQDEGTTQSDDSAADSAAQQLEDAAQDGQEAVEAPSDEGAKTESNETFDTPHDSDGD
jgi:hypothetical protein